jgi:hypothetical protein
LGFLTGSVSFERFRVESQEAVLFSQEHVEILQRFAIGEAGPLSIAGLEVGFTAGGHMFDLDFSLDKNVINDALHCALRIDTNKVPAAMKKAYI